jgi:hypothetical protein
MALTGTQLVDSIWVEVVEFIPKNKQDEVALRLVNIFIDADVDGIADSDQAKIRKALKLIEGEDIDDEEDNG